MVYQMRIYTINRGMMDSWQKLFNEHIRPLHDRLGIPVQNSWVNADRTEFIWVRQFNSAEDIPVKEAAFFASPERIALGDRPTSHIAKMEVRVIEAVPATAGVA
ncbi:MAG: NIPSNAP family protein [Chloroflexi bacterium]|nr:NIPSNAP family protein [Chloroflexota bacterium]MDA1219743.1 NIPSNAP family protein [Chloroflexota bacterium]PKB57179.1 MAG: hypothetical protein BZY73_04315 [SAR202 cluster bacterium Casp-Chloro-G3]